MKINGLKIQAVKLRKNGYSFQQIHEKLNIAKSTCYVWLKDVKLDKFAVNRLKARGDKGRQKGWNTNKQKLLARNIGINKKVQGQLKTLVLDGTQEKLACSILYWAEGSKGRKGIAFTNSDPEMIKTFMTLFRKSFRPSESKFQASLHLHGYHKQELQKKFWSKITQIPQNKISIYKKPHTGKNTRPDYPGCISVRYNNVEVYEEIKAYYKNFAKKYGGLVQW